MHCLWAKLNNRTRGHFKYDVALFIFIFVWFCFCSPHAQCGCFSIVCLRFQVIQIKQMQIKQVDCKMSIKISSKKNFFKTTFCDHFGQLHPQECKVTKK